MTKIHFRALELHARRFEVVHLLKSNEMAGNRGYLQADPISLVLPWYIKWPVQPPTAIYPEALIRDARLEKHHKGRGELLLTDSTFFTTIWTNDARSRDVQHYVKRWHHVQTAAQEADDRKRVEDELRIRAKFHRDVYEIMRSRERAHLKAARLQAQIFHFLRTERHKLHQREVMAQIHLIKEGFKRHAKFLEWRLDNMFLETDTHSLVRVKHHGKAIEHVMGNLLWQARVDETLKHQKWRHDDNYVPLPSGGLERVHHAAGHPLQQVLETLHRPVLDERAREFRRWHRERYEILTPNHNIVHAQNGGGELPEAASAKIWLPELRAEHRATKDWHRSHNVTPLANGGFASDKMGGGLMPERLTAAIDAIKKHKVTAAHSAFRANHEFVKTANGNIAPLKSHGKSLEAVSGALSDVARKRTLLGIKEWHDSHQFRETSNHVVVAVRTGGQQLERVSAKHYNWQRDLITRRFEERALNNLYVPTINGGLRRLRGHGQRMEYVKDQIREPVDALASGLLPYKDGHVFSSAKAAVNSHELNEKRRHLQQVHKSLAAHDRTTSRLNGHIVMDGSNASAMNSDTPTHYLNATHWKKTS